MTRGRKRLSSRRIEWLQKLWHYAKHLLWHSAGWRCSVKTGNGLRSEPQIHALYADASLGRAMADGGQREK
jgi:hypothetical protein